MFSKFFKRLFKSLKKMKLTSLKWEIGQVEIYQIVELEAGEIIQSIIPEATPENIKKIDWLYPNFADENGNLKALVQGFLIKSESKNILIDTCNGNDKKRTDAPEWGNLQTDFLTKLIELGVSPDDVDVVACTHLHMDHVGWNTKLEKGEWIPTFPNAQYLFDSKEFEYWEKKPEKEIDDDHAAFEDSVMPVIKAGLAKLVDSNHAIDKNISFIPTPGHTPSHVSVLIESEGRKAIISGDLLHHPCQIANPSWVTEADTFPDKAKETRTNLFEEITDTDTLFIGSHFSNPVAGKIVRSSGEGFVFMVKDS